LGGLEQLDDPATNDVQTRAGIVRPEQYFAALVAAQRGSLGEPFDQLIAQTGKIAGLANGVKFFRQTYCYQRIKYCLRTNLRFSVLTNLSARFMLSRSDLIGSDDRQVIPF